MKDKIRQKRTKDGHNFGSVTTVTLLIERQVRILKPRKNEQNLKQPNERVWD